MVESSSPQKTSRFLFWGLVALALLGGAIIVWPFVPALLWATVLSVLMWPIFRRLEPRLGPNNASLVATFLTAILIVVPFAGIGTVAGAQVYQFTNKLLADRPPGDTRVTIDQVALEADEILAPVVKQIGLGDLKVSTWIESNRSRLADTIGRPLWTGLSKLIVTIVTMVIALLTMFFMLRDGRKLLDPVLEIVPLPRSETLRILNRMWQTIHSVFVGIVLVSVIQAFIAGVTYAIVGVPAPLVWAIVTFFFCTIPLLGSPVIYIPLALRLLMEGHVTQALVLLAVGFGIISQIDNILRPFFIGARSGLHPMAVFFSLLGGVLALGPIGIMAGPMLLTLILGLLDVIRTVRRMEDGPEEEAIAAPAG